MQQEHSRGLEQIFVSARSSSVTFMLRFGGKMVLLDVRGRPPPLKKAHAKLKGPFSRENTKTLELTKYLWEQGKWLFYFGFSRVLCKSGK